MKNKNQYIFIMFIMSFMSIIAAYQILYNFTPTSVYMTQGVKKVSSISAIDIFGDEIIVEVGDMFISDLETHYIIKEIRLAKNNKNYLVVEYKKLLQYLDADSLLADKGTIRIAESKSFVKNKHRVTLNDLDLIYIDLNSIDHLRTLRNAD